MIIIMIKSIRAEYARLLNPLNLEENIRLGILRVVRHMQK